MNLANLRTEYRSGKLAREDLDADPISQFHTWMKQACDSAIIEPTAMSLATVGSDGHPLLRTVLLKGVDERGFVFFTNLDSRKARQLAQNPNASLMFAWLPLERQVVITGRADRLSTAESFRYFLTRPRDSQVSAWASRQSSIISSRKVLEMEWEHLKAKFGAGQIPLPSFWGDTVCIPTRSSSGRAGRAACTIDLNIRGKQTTPGCFIAWRLRRDDATDAASMAG